MKKQIFTYLTAICFPVLLFSQWSSDPSVNTQVYEGIGSQVQPKVVVNEEGQSYVSWFSEVGPGEPWTVHMQRLDADGNKMWSDTGILISDHATISWTTDYGLALDNLDNAILVTQDQRTGFSDVYTYKMSPSGEFLWGEDGIALTNDEASNLSPKVVSDTEGNNIYIWPHSAISDYSFISLQKLSSDGQELWNDVKIMEDTMHCWQPTMIRSGDSDVIVVWIETTTTDTTIGNWPNMYSYAQKIDANGNFVWPSKVPIDTIENMPLDRFEPDLASDGNGGLFVGWGAYRPNGLYVSGYVQHINGDGGLDWEPNGLAVSDSAQFHQYSPQIVFLPDEDELLVFWDEVREYIEPPVLGAVFGQKFSDAGEKLWSGQGMPFSTWFTLPDTMFALFDVKPATNNDVIVYYGTEYIDFINTDTLFHIDLSAIKIDSEGNYLWENENILFAKSNSGKNQFVSSELVNDQWICLWADNRNDPTHTILTDIYAQNISIDGNMGPLATKENSYISANKLTNYPNPFSQITTVEYKLQNPGSVNISLLNLQGQFIKALYEGGKSSGIHTLQLNGSGFGQGIYFIKLVSGNETSYHKVILSE
ncbi:MAG: hypothetical protein DRJ05_03820 [Bacteroidetes bacterium]|nr:MAG: hypothetical protein DRJ05_03820 [Bacteroidota bacterium]